MTTRTALTKFGKYALIVALADTIPNVMSYLSNASGLSTVDWMRCWDSSGLVFLKALIGGGIGAFINAVMPKKPAA